MSAIGQTGLQTEPRILRVFISYASEDQQIALAIANAIRTALGDGFAEIYIDKLSLQAGDEFKKQIELKLEKTDIFVIVFTGTEKKSHSFSGWEVGYFDRVMKTSPDRKIIPLFLENLPVTASEIQGISLNLDREQLKHDLADFESTLTVGEDDPMCALLAQLQERVDKIRESGGYPKATRNADQSPVTCVKGMKIQIFRYLKCTVETTLKPQKQITIKAKGGSLQGSDADLPADAEIVPVGPGSMSIFGLADVQLTWEKFLQSIADNKFRDSWREAITGVVMSSLPDRINVDNSQIIVSSDEAKTYRVILTTATKFYDDNREFNLYFVETLRKHEYGDATSTLMLKGLELACRFRFMFLEIDSEFSSRNFLANSIDRIPELSKRLLSELNLMRKDTREAGLDQPALWSKFVEWDHIQKMTDEFRPRDAKLREIIQQIIASKAGPEAIPPLRQNLAEVLSDLEEHIRSTNTLLITRMLEKLNSIVKDG